MAYTTDRTWVTGEVVTAAYMNTWLRDNVKWLSTDKPMVRAYNSAAISTATGAVTTLTLNSERFDNAAMHSTSTNTNRLSVSASLLGKYLVGAQIEWAASNVGDYRTLVARVSGAFNIAATTQPPGATNGFCNQCVTGLWELTGADYFDAAAQQNSGGALNVNATAYYSPEVWALWVGV